MVKWEVVDGDESTIISTSNAIRNTPTNKAMLEEFVLEELEMNTPPQGYRWCSCEHDCCGCLCGYTIKMEETNEWLFLTRTQKYNY